MTDKKETREPDFWDAKSSEQLVYTTLDDSVEDYLDQADIELADSEINITVSGCCNMQIPRETLTPLEDLLEVIDEEYGNPEETYEPTEALREAEKAFVDVFLRERS